MKPDIERLLQEYERRSVAEWELIRSLPLDEGTARRDEFLLTVGRSTGALLNIFIKEAKAESILELGTSYGYSTLWLADAAQHTGGKVISIELAPGKSTFACERR